MTNNKPKQLRREGSTRLKVIYFKDVSIHSFYNFFSFLWPTSFCEEHQATSMTGAQNNNQHHILLPMKND